MNRAKHPRQARLRHARAPDPWAVQGGPASLRGRRGLFRVLARGSFLFGGEFSKTPTMISALSLPNFYLSLPKCPRFIQFSRFSYTKPQVMGLLESLDSFDIKHRYVSLRARTRLPARASVGICPGQFFRKQVSLSILLTYRRFLSTRGRNRERTHSKRHLREHPPSEAEAASLCETGVGWARQGQVIRPTGVGRRVG